MSTVLTFVTALVVYGRRSTRAQATYPATTHEAISKTAGEQRSFQQFLQHSLGGRGETRGNRSYLLQLELHQFSCRLSLLGLETGYNSILVLNCFLQPSNFPLQLGDLSPAVRTPLFLSSAPFLHHYAIKNTTVELPESFGFVARKIFPVC